MEKGVRDVDAQTFICNLATRLYKSTRIRERAVGNSVLLFAPDRHGMPVLVNAWVRDLLDRFRGGITVGEVMAQGAAQERDFGELVSVVGFLEEQGFLRTHPDAARYGASKEEYQNIPNSFSVWLSITNSCNLACSYCFVEEMSKKERQVMARDTLESVGAAHRRDGKGQQDARSSGEVRWWGADARHQLDGVRLRPDLVGTARHRYQAAICRLEQRHRDQRPCRRFP